MDMKLFRTFRQAKGEEQEAQRLLEEGERHEQQGLMERALNQYEAAIRLMPRLARAHFNRGNILLDKGEAAAALASYLHTIEYKPDSAGAHSNIGSAHMQLGNPEAAAAACRKAIDINPGLADAHMTLGLALESLGESLRALDSFSRVIELRPDAVGAHHQLGMAYAALKNYDRAVECYRRAIEIDPDEAEIHSNLGTALKAQGDHDAAIASYRRAIELRPDLAEVRYNLGTALKYCGRPAEAIVSFCRAIEIKKDYFEAYLNLGLSYREVQKFDEALECLHQAARLQPGSHGAYLNLGATYAQVGKIGAAIENYQKSLSIEPDNADACVNLACALKDVGEYREALTLLRKALVQEPHHLLAHNNLLFIQNYVEVRAGEELLADALRFGRVVSQKAQPFRSWTRPGNGGRVFRVGFVSGDLCSHPVGHFLVDVLEALSQQTAGHMELYAYPTRFVQDELSQRLQACFKVWAPVVGLADAALATRIHDDEIDVLVDLSGHTAHNRLPVFAWRPAPVQMSWLGYCATTGLSEIDYYLADPFAMPSAIEQQFVETVWRMPESYVCLSRPEMAPPVAALPSQATGRITFASFNNLTKMTEGTVRLWARVLHALPESRLYLKAKQLDDKDVLKATVARYAELGISEDRLICEGHIAGRGAHLAAYSRVDIALDPFPYNGVTTTVEALWMGVPVLTLAGQRFVSHQGVGLLSNAGLLDWVASDADDFVSKAVMHASDLSRLAGVRAGLREKVQVSPLFDAQRFARHFERALRGMWETKQPVIQASGVLGT